MYLPCLRCSIPFLFCNHFCSECHEVDGDGKDGPGGACTCSPGNQTITKLRTRARTFIYHVFPARWLPVYRDWVLSKWRLVRWGLCFSNQNESKKGGVARFVVWPLDFVDCLSSTCSIYVKDAFTLPLITGWYLERSTLVLPKHYCICQNVQRLI